MHVWGRMSSQLEVEGAWLTFKEPIREGFLKKLPLYL
jgi:hypothetical protein